MTPKDKGHPAEKMGAKADMTDLTHPFWMA
jgi:hypothetical protein